jgi:hypothetical protein
MLDFQDLTLLCRSGGYEAIMVRNERSPAPTSPLCSLWANSDVNGSQHSSALLVNKDWRGGHVPAQRFRARIPKALLH